MKKLLSLLLVLTMALTLVSGMALADEEAAAASGASGEPVEEAAADTAAAPVEDEETPVEEAAPAPVQDAESADYSCGENAVWSFDESTGTLTISGTGAMKDYSSTQEIPWFEQYNEKITAIVIESGITHIGNRAFAYLDKVTSLTIGFDVTSIGAYSFAWCYGLREVYIPDCVTSIESSSFQEDTKLSVTCHSGTRAESWADFTGAGYTILPDCEHTWNSGVETKKATCIAEGETVYTCTACGAKKTETVPMSETHSWDEGTVTKAPTCSEAGEKLYTCTVCKKTDTVPVSMLDHSWDDGVVTVPATAAAEGKMTYTCTVCKATKTEPIPMTAYDGTGWLQIGSEWYYFKNSVMVKSDWVKSGGKWYYLCADGHMARGGMYYIQDSDGEHYLYRFNDDGSMVASTWYGGEENWHYCYSNGHVAMGWLKYGGAWYYMVPEWDGCMLFSQKYDIDGKTYFFAASGKMLTGWVYADETGAAVTENGSW